MKIFKTVRRSFVSALILLVVFLFHHRLHAEVKGPPFSDPSLVTDMAQSWKDQGIRYESWAQGADIAITLDQHLYPALTPLIDRYARRNNLKILTKEGTCGISAGLLSRKMVDIGGFCCPPDISDRLPGLRHHTLGISALVIMINGDNPINTLSLQTIRDIFQGSVDNWSQVGGRKGPILPVGRLHCKQRPGHWRLLLDNEDLFSLRMLEVGTIRDMIHTIADDKDAIGYEVMWNIGRHGQTGRIKPLLIDNASPSTPENLISGKYPLYRVYNITTWDEDTGTGNSKAAELVRYLLEHTAEIAPEFDLVPAAKLREAGWKFRETELIGEP